MATARTYYPGMGAGLAEVKWLDNEDLEFGDAADVTMAWDGTRLSILPRANDTGYVRIGNGTLDMDFVVFLGGAAAYVDFNVGNARVDFEAVDLRFGDTDFLQFGDDADVGISWDGNSLNILPLADDTGVIEIGNGTFDIDLQIFLGTAGEFALFDVGNSRLTLNAIDFMAIATAAGNYLEYDASEERVNCVIAAKTPDGNDLAFAIDITTTFDGGDTMVGLNVVMRPQASAGLGTWLSGIYSAVVMGADGVGGYFCAAELEVILTGASAVSEYAVLVLNVNDSMSGGINWRTFILLHDYGTRDMDLFLDIRDLAIGANSAITLLTTSGDRAQDHAIRIRLSDGSIAWLMVTTTAP